MPLTITQLRELLNLKLGNNSNITASKHREVVSALIDTIEFLTPLSSGTYAIGDVIGSDNVRTITFPDVGTANYRVLGILCSKSTSYNTDNDVIHMIKNKTATSFQLCLREVSGEVQSLEFDWKIERKA